jgi:hypothetical protein
VWGYSEVTVRLVFSPMAVGFALAFQVGPTVSPPAEPMVSSA